MVFASGCGDDVTSTRTPLPPSGPIDTGRPPPEPENAAEPDGSGAIFAISNWRLGFTDAHGMKSSNAWKTMGYNLDATVSMRTSGGVIIGGDVCTRVDGGTFNEVVDGDAGRDNRFGAGVLPVIVAAHPEAEATSNELIRRGKHTLLIDVPGLGDSPTYGGLSARMYSARDSIDAQGMPAKPAFDGTDVWPIGGESFFVGAPEKPVASAKGGYLADVGDGGTFVAQFDGSVLIVLDALGLPDDQGLLYLRIYDPLVTMRLSADRMSVESGTLAGFIDTTEIDLEAARLLMMIASNDCNSPTALAIRQQIRRNSDILRGGAADVMKACDSISIGIEFEATRAKLGSVISPIVLPKLSCSTP